MKSGERFDFWLLGPVAYLMLVGLLAIYSIDLTLFWKQLSWVILSWGIILSLSFLNLRAFFSYRWVILTIYFLGILLLLLTYFLAVPIAGTRSWLVLGGFQLQSSELIKVTLIILLSRFFAARHIAIADWRIIFLSFIYVLPPFLLILIQPDLGTALVVFGIWFGYLLVSEMPLSKTLVFFGLFLVVIFLAWHFGFAPYQKERILALFDPNRDPLGVNYSVIQSKIAIGSAGFWGKGFKQGTQTQLGFLPNAATDFIFASFVEEWGLVGGLTIVAAFLILIFRIAFIGESQINNFDKFLCLGTIIVFLLHLAINVGSTLGLLPVVGVSLPFISYGGSNLLTLSFLIGIILSITSRRAGSGLRFWDLEV